MGREWYFNWGTKSSSSKKATKSTTGGVSGGGEGVKQLSTPQPAAATATMAAVVTRGGGCMNAVLHLFDNFHHFQFCSYPHDEVNLTVHPTKSSFPSTSLKGVETVSRKSMESSSSSSKDANFRRDTKLKLAIQTSSKDDNNHQKQEDSFSEGARTPNLVARLMGLDILPEPSYSNTTTPRSSHYSQSLLSTTTTATTPPSTSSRKTRPRSVPETPARRSSTSSSSKLYTNSTYNTHHHVLDRHRLSLEFHKENYSIVREMESSRPSCSAISTKKRDELRRSSSSNYNNNIEEESKSPRYYAKQIMKQVKETVGKRSRRRSFGADITNNTSSNHQIRRDEHLLLTKPKKPSNVNKENSSLKLKSLEPKLETLKSKAAMQEKKQQVQEHNKRLITIRSSVDKPCSKKPLPKSLDLIRKKKEEQFIRPQAMRAKFEKKCKKTPLSSELLHGSVVPSMLPPTKLPHKQGASLKAQSSKLMTSTRAQLSRNPSQGGGRRSKDTTTSSIAEFQYISRILKCTGIDGNTPVSLTTWFSPTHYLDPSIFHNLENTHYAPTRDIDSSPVLSLSFSNRRLIFHLVDEILAKDYHQEKQVINGFELVKMLGEKIRSLPCINCQTLQDIDALVEKDLPKFYGAHSNLNTFEEEGEAIVSEIEQDIVDSLVQEIAVFMFCSGMRRSSMQRYVTIIN